MTDSADKCSTCLKPKRQSGRGTLTQWIVVCRCDSTVPELDVSIRICRQCRKQITPSRPGSFTQWIFGPNRCTCETPIPGGFSDTAIGAQVEEASSEEISNEPELPLGSKDFPLSRYKPLSELGRGTSGTVYLCRDRLIGNRVAVKVLHDLTGEQLLSFQQEARISSKLDHPNIVRILDFGPTDSGAPYMVMQYAKGVTLEEHLKEHGPVDEFTARTIFSQACQALEHAHARGVFHRDLKPSNILLIGNQDGADTIKLIDFGVAQVIQLNQEPTIVQGRTIVGTPSYMPPEMISGGHFDARSDLYSLACVIFESIVGSPPFSGESALALLAKHAQEPAPLPSESAGKELPFFDGVLPIALAKLPEERFQSAAEFEEALKAGESFGTSVGAEHSEPVISNLPESEVQRKRLIIGAAIAVPVCCFALFFAWNSYTNQQTDKTSSASKPSKSQDSEKTERLDESSMAPDRLNAIQQEDIRNSEFETKAAQGDAHAQIAQGLKSFQREDYTGALEWFKKSAAQGNATAQANLGYMYLKGRGVKQDNQEAFKYLKQSADGGSPLGQGFLGVMYKKGWGCTRDDREALRLYRLGAKGGDALSQDGLGYMYQNGQVVEKDPAMALKYYRLAAAQNYSASLSNLGTMYELGEGVEKNYREAARLYRLAMEKGHLDSYNKLGFIYQKGLGVRKDMEYAIKLFDVAASNGDAAAQNNLGYIYQHGMGVPKDYDKSIQYYRQAAKQGNATAQSNLGFMYQNGSGVEKNYEQAVKLYEMAARQGKGSALANLGYMYGKGLGVPQSYVESAKYSEQAAQKGYVAAQVSIARMYRDGLGVPKDQDKAIFWYRKASAQGAIAAQDQMGVFYENGLGVKKDLRAAAKYYRIAAKRGDKHSQTRLIDLYRRHPELKSITENRDDTPLRPSPSPSNP